MALVVAPFDHKYAIPVLAVKVTTLPVHKFVLPEFVIVGMAADPTVVAVIADVPEQPPDCVTLTV